MSAPAPTSAAAQDFDAAAFYKGKCQMCHTPTAKKFFDPTKDEAALVDAVLKGVAKTDDHAAMPGYEAKGVTADQAKALIAHMKTLAQ